MKRIIALVLALIMVSAIGITCFARDWEIISPEASKYTLEELEKNGVVIEIGDNKFVITSETKDAFKEVTPELVEQLIEELKDKGFVIDGHSIITLDTTEFPMTITLSGDSIKRGDIVYILQKINEEWVYIPSEMIDDEVRFTLKEQGPFAVIIDKADEHSPETGLPVAAFAVVALISLAGAAYAVKRSFNA